MIDFFKDNLSFMGLQIAEEKIAKIWQYWQLLLAKNKTLNLISPKQELKEQIIVHLVDSLSPLLSYELQNNNWQSLDLGSGGGLPALPLAIVMDQWQYQLFEAKGKKADFLREAQSQLALSNIAVNNEFLERGTKKYQLKFDLATARAVSSLDNLLPAMAGALKEGGLLVAMKGPKVYQELLEAKNIIRKCRLNVIEELSFKLPYVKAERVILIFKKN